MPNFNSREVAEKLSGILNMHDHVRPGSDRLAYAAAILDSALLAANPGARKLADFAFVSGFNFGRKGFQTTGELEHENASRRGKAVSKIAAALESAKREAAPKWISVEDRYPEDGQTVAFVVDEKIDYYGGSVCAGRFRYFNYGGKTGRQPEFSTWGLGGLPASHWMPLPSVDSLAEKEGGR